ncbi:hypothetical protein BEYONPHE_149 [Bacillus phage Beyonphe]|nr:hypothetical protein BEYONPHE_149 [Bacillus phage Beyonphe]
MSSYARDMVEAHETYARQIQSFMWEGKPNKSNKKVHTVEELEDFLENLRKDAWSNYDNGAYSLGWRG